MVPLELGPGCRVVLEARAPSDDSQVGGIPISDATIYARSGDGTDELAPLSTVWLQTEGT